MKVSSLDPDSLPVSAGEVWSRGRHVDAGVPFSRHRKWYGLLEVCFCTESGTGHWIVNPWGTP